MLQLFIGLHVVSNYDIGPRTQEHGLVSPAKVRTERLLGVRSWRRNDSWSNGSRGSDNSIRGTIKTSSAPDLPLTTHPLRGNISGEATQRKAPNQYDAVFDRSQPHGSRSASSGGHRSGHSIVHLLGNTKENSSIISGRNKTSSPRADETMLNESFARDIFQTSSFRMNSPSAPSTPTSESTAKVDVLMRRTPLRSRSEVLRVHRPFVIGTLQQRPSNESLRRWLHCTDFSKSITIPTRSCLEFLTPKGDEHVDSSYGMVAARAPHRRFNRTSCSTGSALIVPLHLRDKNVSNLLMKFLLAFSVYKRAVFSPGWLEIPPVESVIVLASPPLQALFLNNGSSFHSGLLEALFTQHGVNVVIRRGLGKLEARYRCFGAGVFVGRFANRFAYPDAELGETSSYYGLSALPFPLSSDALVLRAHIFKERPVPKKRFKVVYVARKAGKRCTWTKSSELEMRSMLREVSWKNGAQLVVFEGGSEMGFEQQIRFFTDAAIVVGFHGDGLALSVFAPRGAKVIEIEPEYLTSDMFGLVQSSGLSYELIRLAKGSSNGSVLTSRLIPHDKQVIESLLERSLQEVVKLG